jgi:hypothetical protein
VSSGAVIGNSNRLRVFDNFAPDLSAEGIGPQHLMALIRHSNGALQIVLQLSGREDLIAAKTLLDARNTLAEILARIDSWMNGEGHPR